MFNKIHARVLTISSDGYFSWPRFTIISKTLRNTLSSKISCVNKSLQKQKKIDISFFLQLDEHSQQDHAKTVIARQWWPVHQF